MTDRNFEEIYQDEIYHLLLYYLSQDKIQYKIKMYPIIKEQNQSKRLAFRN